MTPIEDMSPQCRRVWEFVLANPGCTTMDLIQGAGVCNYKTRLWELRKAGYDTKAVRAGKTATGAQLYRYFRRPQLNLGAPEPVTTA